MSTLTVEGQHIGSGGGAVAGAHLAAVGVSAWFGSHKVLERVSLEMPPGIVTALIGPSGCGKSTFLRTLNRMHETIPGAQFGGEVQLTGATSVAFAWLRNGTAISGATASTYKTASADFQQDIKCRATGTNTSGSTPSTSAAVTIASGDALVNTTLPKATGTAAVWQTLSCSPGSWTPKAASYKYQWLRNGNAVQGATSKSFTVPTGYRGDKVACKVTAAKKGFAKGIAKSAVVTIG